MVCTTGRGGLGDWGVRERGPLGVEAWGRDLRGPGCGWEREQGWGLGCCFCVGGGVVCLLTIKLNPRMRAAAGTEPSALWLLSVCRTTARRMASACMRYPGRVELGVSFHRRTPECKPCVTPSMTTCPCLPTFLQAHKITQGKLPRKQLHKGHQHSLSSHPHSSCPASPPSPRPTSSFRRSCPASSCPKGASST